MNYETIPAQRVRATRSSQGELIVTDRRQRSEPELRRAVLHMLRSHGLAVQSSVACAVGEADIVTERRDVIFEVKYRLTRTALYQAIGQILLYRTAINPQARAVIVGYATSETLTLLPSIEALGIEVVPWMDRPEEPGIEIAELETGQAAYPEGTMAQRATLRWNVASLALAKSFKNVPELAFAMGNSRQATYNIWKGEAAQVSLEMLSRLARTLDAHPGDWFTWVEATQRQTLAWQVRERMEALGLEPIELGFRSRLYSASIVPIVDGSAKSVAIATLARLAQALDTPECPFSTGDLFRWEFGPSLKSSG